MPEVVRTHTEFGIDPRRLAFCADLASPEKLMTEGTIDQSIRVAIAQGVSPVHAVQMATINTAEVFYVQRDFGVVAPGRYADLLLVVEPARLRDRDRVFGGEEVVENGEFLLELPKTEYPDFLRDTVKLPQPITRRRRSTFRVDQRRARSRCA